MKKNNIILAICVLALTFTFTLRGAEESILDLTRTMKSHSNAPVGWYPNPSKDFAPVPTISYVTEDGIKALKITGVQGKSGCRFDNYKKKSVLKGDKIILTAEARGKGTGAFTVQCYSDKKWMGHIGIKKFDIPATWGTIKVEFDIVDIAEQNPTTSVICHFGIANGAEIELRSLKYERVAELSGSAVFPNIWTAFLPMDAAYQPTAQELVEIPQKLNGVEPRKVQFIGSEYDFKPAFGGKPGPLMHGAGNCVWLYGVINCDEAEDYTIGAGADWWMQVNLNGKPVIDTLKNGNVVHPPRITDYKQTVRLKKGRNVLAVKYLTGGGSSKLALGGPNELRAIGQKFRMTEELCLDDFETVKVKRPGNPEIVSGEYNYAVVAASRQGHYTAKPTLEFAPIRQEYNMPKIASGQFFALAFRLIKFQDNSGDLSFRFTDAKSGKNFALQLIQKSGDKNLKINVVENGKVINSYDYPVSLIPMDVLLNANAKGEYKLALETMVDSSVKYFSGKSNFFGSVDGNTFKADAILKAVDGKSSGLFLDNWAYGFSMPERMKQTIPMDINVQNQFDPVKAGWKLVLEDDFNKPELNQEIWYPYSPNYQIKDGMVQFKMGRKKESDGKVRYVTGGFFTKQLFSYGFFEARLRFRQNPGWITACWLYGGQTGNSFLDGMEIDIYEDYYVTKERPLLDFNFHGFVGRVMKSWNYVANVPGPVEDFYTVGCKWTPFEITYYLNGKAIKSTANHSPHNTITYDALNHRNGFAPLRLCFYGKPTKEYGGGNPIVDKGEFPDTFKIDWVRIYAYPHDKDPSVKLAKADNKLYIEPGEKFEIEAIVKPNAKTKAPIKGVYLFDSGCLLDYKDKPPYKFTVTIDEEYYASSSYMRTGRSREKPNLHGVLHAYSIYAQDAKGEVANSEVVLKMTRPQKKSTPYQGKAQVIPGVVRVAYYDEGGNGVGYLDDNVNVNAKSGFRTDEGVDAAGDIIGHVITGEWINMTVDIQKAGKYTAVLDYGAPAGYGGRMVMTLNDKVVLGTFDCPNNGGSGWGGQKSTLKGIELPAGRHTIKLIVIGAFNYGNLTFTAEK